MKRLNVSGVDDCIKAAGEESKSGAQVYVLFCGSRLENGDSWCPDCVKGDFNPHNTNNIEKGILCQKGSCKVLQRLYCLCYCLP